MIFLLELEDALSYLLPVTNVAEVLEDSEVGCFEPETTKCWRAQSTAPPGAVALQNALRT